MKGFWEKGVAFRTGVPGRQVLFFSVLLFVGGFAGLFCSVFFRCADGTSGSAAVVCFFGVCFGIMPRAWLWRLYVVILL